MYTNSYSLGNACYLSSENMNQIALETHIMYCVLGLCDLGGSPPTIWVDRNWVVDSTAPVGTVVARVRVADVGNETLQYGLEHSTGFNIVQENEEPLPFTIDENGRVTTNTTLTNKVWCII